MNYYQRKMRECLDKYQDAVESNMDSLAKHWMREYLNYERMSKMIMR